MKWIDQPGYSCAVGWSGAYCVTVGGLQFMAPILVGDLVELRALVIRTGRTSVDIAVDVYTSDPKQGERRRTCHCVIALVALDAENHPSPVPPWQPSTAVDRALQGYAQRVAEMRLQMDAEMEHRLALLSSPN